MSTKKTTEKATVCAGCEKRDATIKRQADTMEFWFHEYCNGLRYSHAIRDERDALQSRIDSFIATCADIRAACADAGIEHADKMATLTAVKALAENAKKAQVAWREADNALRTRPTCEMLTDMLRDFGVHCERTDRGWKVSGLRRTDKCYIAIPRIRIAPCERPTFFIALFTAIAAWGVVLATLFS